MEMARQAGQLRLTVFAARVGGLLAYTLLACPQLTDQMEREAEGQQEQREAESAGLTC
jgi:hypothetical protein